MTIPADQLVFVAERIVAVGCTDLMRGMAANDRRAFLDDEAAALADLLADTAADHIDDLRENLKERYRWAK